MATMEEIIGIHKIVLLSEAEPNSFEEFMKEEVFPSTAEVPGSVDRAGRSAIKSQHLVKNDESDRGYYWIVKYSGFLSPDKFRHIFHEMLANAREKLEAFGSIESSGTYTAVDSLDVGPRDELGRPVGSPGKPEI